MSRRTKKSRPAKTMAKRRIREMTSPGRVAKSVNLLEGELIPVIWAKNELVIDDLLYAKKLTKTNHRVWGFDNNRKCYQQHSNRCLKDRKYPIHRQGEPGCYLASNNYRYRWWNRRMFCYT